MRLTATACWVYMLYPQNNLSKQILFYSFNRWRSKYSLILNTLIPLLNGYSKICFYYAILKWGCEAWGGWFMPNAWLRNKPFPSVTLWLGWGGAGGMRTSLLPAAAPIRHTLSNVNFRTGCWLCFLPRWYVEKFLCYCLSITIVFSLKPSMQRCRSIY